MAAAGPGWRSVAGVLALVCLVWGGQPAWSQAGRSTGLPLPRFVSLAAERVNVRFGPGRQYPVSWMFARKGLPVEIIAEFDTWRKIRDYDGEEGWIHSSLLSSRRTIMVIGEVRALRRTASTDRARGAARRAGRDRHPVRLRGHLVPGRDRGPPRLAAAQRVLGHAARRDRALGRRPAARRQANRVRRRRRTSQGGGPIEAVVRPAGAGGRSPRPDRSPIPAAGSAGG